MINAAGVALAQVSRSLPPSREIDGVVCQDPGDWWRAVTQCFELLADRVPLASVTALAVDSTSGTLLLCDVHGTPITPALMYNDQRPQEIAMAIGRAAGGSAAASVTSSLAKLIWLHRSGRSRGAAHALHAADWLAGCLTGRFGVSDHHNALKTGFDVISQRWPQWLAQLDVPRGLLPVVVEPGTPLGELRPDLAQRYGFSARTRVLSGTTDSIAAFLASGARLPGDAVTVLGSTLVTKVVSTRPVTEPGYGVYSHRIGEHWLVGGASNSGGRALERYIGLDEIRRLSNALATDQPSDLDYYPLPAIGERFPIADPAMTSRVAPVPSDRRVFLQGLLEGIARIERDAYQLLAQLGAAPVRRLYSTGGGAANMAWSAIRKRVLGDIEFATADHAEAAYGSARLALEAQTNV